MVDDKNSTIVMEEKNSAITEETPPVSAFATLTRAQAVRKFWRLYLCGLGACVAGMYVFLSFIAAPSLNAFAFIGMPAMQTR